MTGQMTKSDFAKFLRETDKRNGKPEKRFDIIIKDRKTGVVMCMYQRDMPESRALNYQAKAYAGLGKQDEYMVELTERKQL